jgi:hypothetical protein
MNNCQGILRPSYGTPVLRLSLTVKWLDFVQYFSIFTKNERQIRILKSDSNRQALRNWTILRRLPMMVNTDIFESHLSCKYKTYLRLRGKTTLTSEFDLIHTEWTTRYKDRVLQILRDRYHLDSGHSLSSCQNDLGNGAPALFKCRLKSAKIECQCDVLEKVQGESDTNPLLYIPIRKDQEISLAGVAPDDVRTKRTREASLLLQGWACNIGKKDKISDFILPCSREFLCVPVLQSKASPLGSQF